MSFRFNHQVLLAAAAMCVACGDVAAQLATGSFDRTLDVDEPVELEVMTGSGSIDVRQGSAGEVRVAARISVGRASGRGAAEAEDIVRRLEDEPPIEVTGNRVSIGRVDDRELQQNVSISYEIVVPAETSVRSRTGSGNQSLAGLNGRVEATTGSGDVSVENIAGPVDARTGSGGIEGTDIAGAFTAQTGSGGVRLVQSGAGDVNVSTGSGSTDLRGIEGSLRARTGSGSIEVEGTQQGAWDLETGSGSVRVRLPSEAGFEINARTGSGEVFSSHPITFQGRIERGRLMGQVRGGGPLLQIRTGSGSIRIE